MSSKSASAQSKQSKSNPSPVEELESRTYFDLVPTVVTVPASLVATVKTPATITVDLTNSGDTKIKGPYTLELFASPDGLLVDATPLLTRSGNLPALPAGKTRVLRLPLGAFPLVATGNYTILAQVSGPLAVLGDDVGASATQVAVAAPFVDLTGAIPYNGSASVKAGQSIVDILTITNQGNIPAKGPLEVDLSATTNADGSDATQFTTLTVILNVGAGKEQTFHFPFVIPPTIPPATYYGVANIDPGNTFGESDITNNTAVSPIGLTILSPYPNIVGELTGPYDFSTGQDKGTTGTLDIIVTSEDNTGALTGSGTSSNGAVFNFTGTITIQGVVNLTTDIPGGSTLTGHFANGTLSGTIDLTAKGSTGQFTISLPSAHRPGHRH